MLVSAMKAGYSFQAATQFIGEEMIAAARAGVRSLL